MEMICWQDHLPRDLVDTFHRNDQDLIRHLIGHDRYHDADQRGMTFRCELGRWDMLSQTVAARIWITGPDKLITFWLLKY